MLTGEAEAVLKHSDKIEEEVGIGAVSYTHLDVYKRQDIHR